MPPRSRSSLLLVACPRRTSLGWPIPLRATLGWTPTSSSPPSPWLASLHRSCLPWHYVPVFILMTHVIRGVEVDGIRCTTVFSLASPLCSFGVLLDHSVDTTLLAYIILVCRLGGVGLRCPTAVLACPTSSVGYPSLIDGVLDAGVPGCTDRDRWLAAPNPSLPTEILTGSVVFSALGELRGVHHWVDSITPAATSARWI